MMREDISPFEKLIWLALCDEQEDGVLRGQGVYSYLMGATGIQYRQVWRCLDRLERVGLITRQKQRVGVPIEVTLHPPGDETT